MTRRHRFRIEGGERETSTMWGFLSLLIAIAGILLYALAANPKLQEVGRISFGCGLLAFLLQNGTHIVALTGH